MKIRKFEIERYFERYEFHAKYLLSSSDCDPFSIRDILDLASPEEKEQWDHLRLGYSETGGSPSLREAISTHYSSITPEDVFVSSPGELNFALMNVLLSPEDEVVCMAPMYQSIYEVARAIGCKVVFWEPDLIGDEWYYDPEKLKNLVGPKTRLISVNFPHNPTGFVPELEDLVKIIEVAREGKCYLFSDEMYRFLLHEGREALPSVCDLYEKGVSLWGTSKSFGLAGLRLGWITTKNKNIISQIASFNDYLSICNGPMTEFLSCIALNNHARFISHNLNTIHSNIVHFQEFCVRFPSCFSFNKTRGGSTAFVRLETNEKAMDFAERVVAKTGIMLLPSETFEFRSGHLRIGFGRKNMKEALNRLGDFLSK